MKRHLTTILLAVIAASSLVGTVVDLASATSTHRYRVRSIADADWNTFDLKHKGCDIVAARRALDSHDIANYEVILKCDD